MKVLLFSDVQRKGGAGIAADRLAHALRDAGHEVRWATPHPDPTPDIPTYHCREFSTADRAVFKLSLALLPGQKQAVDARMARRRLNQIIEEFRPDVVNVHNLHGASLPATLPAELSRQAPVVWTLHDMWAFTGTCAYALDCRAFERGCTASCEHAEQYPASPPEAVPVQYHQRRHALRQAGRLAFATPSQWLADEAQRGLLRGHEVRAIANSVELDRFQPIDRTAARRALDLPEGRPVLVTAATLGDPRKGAATLHDAMRQLNRPEAILLQLGGSKPEQADGWWDHRVLGNMHDPRLLRLAYSAADVHVLPTLADNLPNTLLEASACGTPSLGSDVGGVGEAIDPRATGWLAPPSDAGALAEAIRLAIDEPDGLKRDRRRACRALAEARFDPRRQAQQYTELFEETLAVNSRKEAA